MTVYEDAFSAIRARLLAIGLAALFAGVAAFAITYFTMPRIDVVGFVEVARVHHVDADGNVRQELPIPPIVLASQINSGAFFEEPGAAAGKPAQLRRATFVARVPPRTDTVELSTSVDTASEGIQAITGLVRRIGAAHQALQQPTLDRLQKRYASLQAEREDLVKARRQLESMVAEVGKGGGNRDGLQNFVVVSLRAQLNKDLRELDRLSQSTSDAIALTREHQTRLVGNLIPSRASVLACLAFGIVAGVLGGLIAAAVFAGRAYWRDAAGQ